MQNSRIKRDRPIVFKVIVIGASGVGKSSMLIRYIKGNFKSDYQMTVGVQFASKILSMEDNQQIKLQIWDTVGLQSFRSMVRSFYKGIAGVFVAFSITKKMTLAALNLWVKQIRQYGHQEIVLFLVGTKSDLENQREVTKDMVQQYLKQIGAVYYVQTSAKDGTGIEQLFTKSTQFMYKKYVAKKSYRELVAPISVSILEPGRSNSQISSVKGESIIIRKKQCCKS